MPWGERTVSQMREEFVKRVLAQEKSKSALCREYGISRPTGDKWIARYMAGDAMSDHSRKPHTSPGQTPADTEKLVADYRRQHPAIGAVKIHRILQNDGYSDLPSPRTINNILKRNGLISAAASLAVKPCQRFEKAQPNEMWQADYKGHFMMKNGERCHPLNIIDDHSRFNLCCEAQRSETLEEIRPVMIRLFEEFGLPFSFLCDNGNPWGTPQSTGFSRFEVWMMELGILVLHGRVRHPQTQGKGESFNRSMTRELLRNVAIDDWSSAQRHFDEYREFYNCVRPHCALGMDIPSNRYSKSGREYQSIVRSWEYPEGFSLRKVKETGFFNHGGQGYYLSEAFGGKEIAVRESHLPGQISLFFRQFRIGRIDVEKRVYTFKRAYLIDGDPRS